MSTLKILYQGKKYEYRGDNRPPKIGESYLASGRNLVSVALSDHRDPANIVVFIPETMDYAGDTYEFTDFRVAEKGETILKGKYPSGVTHRTRIEYHILERVK